MSKATFSLPKDIYLKINKLANKSEHATFIILLSGIHFILNRYTNEVEITTFMPVTNWMSRESSIDSLLPIRSTFCNGITFKQLIQHIKKSASKFTKESMDPYNVAEDILKDDTNKSNIILVSYNEIHNSSYQTTVNCEYKFEFELLHESLELTIIYGDSLEKQYIDRMFAHMVRYFKIVMENPDAILSEVDILSEEERRRIIEGFNNGQPIFNVNKSIKELFEEQVEKTPNDIAVVFQKEHLTYRELNNEANKLAWTLKANGVNSNSIVGLLFERSINMIVGIMATLKAGGAYLPIDPSQPEDRIKYILEDSKASMLLTQTEFLGRSAFVKKTLNLDDKRVFSGNLDNLDKVSTCRDLAYVIYTSGSTGTPKGTLVEQYGVIIVVKLTNYLEINSEDSVIQLSNYAFDASVLDIFGALLNGARLVIPSREEIYDWKKLGELIKEEISIAVMTTSLFNSLVEMNLECFNNVKKILFGGERISTNHVKKALIALGKNKIIHVYGPTESTIFSTYYPINEIAWDDINIPIGKAVANTKLYVLGRNKEIQPIGVPGELYISGDGLARGYLNNERLTSENFIDNPFEQGKKMYSTGDLVKWLENGMLEFIDRIDNQVKIRGFRIEIGEIENKLLMVENITHVAVLDKKDKNGAKYLCAYIVSNAEMNVSQLRKHLSTVLPEYMIPKFFVKLDKMPINQNGKIDRKYLYDYVEIPEYGADYIAPASIIQKRLSEIWSGILSVDKIGINNNFFEIGGNSLTASMLMLKIQKEFNVHISMKDIFDNLTINNIEQYINNKRRSAFQVINVAERKDFYLASSQQRSMYVSNMLSENSTVYNIVRAENIFGEINVERLEMAFRELIKRHEALRTSFHLINGEINQKIHDEVEFALDYLELQGKEIDHIIKRFNKPFELKKAPLIRIGILQINQNNHILIINIHHIIADGISMGIIMKEVSMLYEKKELNKIELNYKDYSEWRTKLEKSDFIKNQQDYWVNMFKNNIPLLEMPLDYPRPNVKVLRGDCVYFTAGEHLTDKLNKFALENNVTLFMVLLTAYNLLLAKYTSQEDIIIGTPIAGRNYLDLTNIVGVFINTLAMRNYPNSNKSVKDFLSEVRKNCIEAYDNQHFSFERLVEELNISRENIRNPIFDSMFVLQNTDIGSLDIQDLQSEIYRFNQKESMFDITLEGIPGNNDINFTLEYNTQIFSRRTSLKFVKNYIKIINIMLNSIDLKINQLKLD